MSTTIEVDGRSIRDVGSRAHLNCDLEVLVIAVQIQPGPRISYCVAWTLDASRSEAWVEESELGDLT